MARRILRYVPLVVVILLILSPHPSILIFLTRHYLLTLHNHTFFAIHLLATYTLTLLAFNSLIACNVRDPGPVQLPSAANQEESVEEALMAKNEDGDEYMKPGRWCRKCWAPKPERAHHCGACGRCVLKMDHHCPWLGNRCIGQRTYPSFLHFLLCTTLLSLYVAILAFKSLYAALFDSTWIDESLALHLLFLAAIGGIFTLTIGSFLGYHIYLLSTNQTTLEHISPYLLLRHLPPIKDITVDTPTMDADYRSIAPFQAQGSALHEDELSYEQRRLIRRAHSKIRPYDLGWRRNIGQVLGWGSRGKKDAIWKGKVVLSRILWGGHGFGDGHAFPRNPNAEEKLNKLATRLRTCDDPRE